MVALIQFSWTSAKKLRTASSVAEESGFAATEEERIEGEGAAGWWRRRNFAFVGVT